MNIDWHLEGAPVISAKDALGLPFREAETCSSELSAVDAAHDCFESCPSVDRFCERDQPATAVGI
jgi:hypothetical protein